MRANSKRIDDLNEEYNFLATRNKKPLGRKKNPAVITQSEVWLVSHPPASFLCTFQTVEKDIEGDFWACSIMEA